LINQIQNTLYNGVEKSIPDFVGVLDCIWELVYRLW